MIVKNNNNKNSGINEVKVSTKKILLYKYSEAQILPQY